MTRNALDYFSFATRPRGIDADHARNVLLPNGLQVTYAFVHAEFEDFDVRKNGHYAILPSGRVFPMRGVTYRPELSDEEVVERAGDAMAQSLMRPRVTAAQWEAHDRQMAALDRMRRP